MTAVDRQRGRDAALIKSMVRSGMASPATYVPPGSSDPPTPCAVVVRRDVQQIGSDGQVIGNLITIDFQLLDAQPRAGGVVVVEGAETFVLVSNTNDDASISSWVVRK